MTIKLTIDGPKGSGKSTLAKKLANKIGFEHYYFGPDKSYLKRTTQTDYHNMLVSKDDYILERGPLSDMIYLMTRGAIPTFDVKIKEGMIDVNYDWLPVTLDHLSNYYDNADLNVVLYASDTRTLMNNLDNRNEDSGKYLTDEEISFLNVENNLYKSIYLTLEEYKPKLSGKMIFYDVSKNSYDYLEKLIINALLIDELKDIIKTKAR